MPARKRAADAGPAAQLMYENREGKRIEIEARDFPARVIQHETDHLDGILYPMRIHDLRNFGFSDALFPGDFPGED